MKKKLCIILIVLMTISTLSFTSASAENKNIVVDFESLYADKKEIRVGENNIIGIRIESNEEVCKCQ